MARRVRRSVDAAQVSVLAVVVLSLAIAGCRGKTTSPPPLPANTVSGSAAASGDGSGDGGAGETVEFTGIEIPFHSASGDIQGVVRAESAEGNVDAGTGSLKNVTMEARESGVVVAAARAGAARLASGSQEVRFVGGVVFELKRDDASVKADEMVWNWQSGKYVGTGNVHVHVGEAVGRGSRVVGNTRTGEVSLAD